MSDVENSECKNCLVKLLHWCCPCVFDQTKVKINTIRMLLVMNNTLAYLQGRICTMYIDLQFRMSWLPNWSFHNKLFSIHSLVIELFVLPRVLLNMRSYSLIYIRNEYLLNALVCDLFDHKEVIENLE